VMQERQSKGKGRPRLLVTGLALVDFFRGFLFLF
jgi:hypothetical protein